MAVLTVRNLPSAVHRALRLRAARHGRSMEAEVRSILEASVHPPERVKLGSLLRDLRAQAGLIDADVDAMEQARVTAREQTPHEPLRFD